MDAIAVLRDGFERVREAVHEAADGADAGKLAYRAGPEANSMAWLLWHLARVQDHHVSQLSGSEQRWLAGGWAARCGMEADPNDTGYGASPDDVARVRVDSSELLVGYFDDVHSATLAYLAGLSEASLEDVVDERFDPPVTRCVRLVSVIADDLQHAGQAGYVRGLAERAETARKAPPA